MSDPMEAAGTAIREQFEAHQATIADLVKALEMIAAAADKHPFMSIGHLIEHVVDIRAALEKARR